MDGSLNYLILEYNQGKSIMVLNHNERVIGAATYWEILVF